MWTGQDPKPSVEGTSPGVCNIPHSSLQQVIGGKAPYLLGGDTQLSHQFTRKETSTALALTAQFIKLLSAVDV